MKYLTKTPRKIKTASRSSKPESHSRQGQGVPLLTECVKAVGVTAAWAWGEAEVGWAAREDRRSDQSRAPILEFPRTHDTTAVTSTTARTTTTTCTPLTAKHATFSSAKIKIPFFPFM